MKKLSFLEKNKKSESNKKIIGSEKQNEYGYKF